jgi:hypothetical protein
MLLHPEERHKLNLEHARWRVSFLLSLLEAHRKFSSRRDDAWARKEAGYLRQLSNAQGEIERLVREWEDAASPSR